MIAAVSAVSRPSAANASTTSTGWHFTPVPDLNRETKRLITKASAWPTFMGICFALRQEGRKGRTPEIRKAAKIEQRVGVGLRHLARDMGLNVSTVRRHVRRLVDLGLIVIHRPNVTFKADLATGRIVTKAKGRCENTRVYLTIQPHHLRPAKATGMGAKRTHPSADLMAHNAPTVRECFSQRTPDGDAFGIGTPPASADAGLSAGQAGGHPAAGTGRLPAAGHEEQTPILPVDAGRDEPPPMPPGRLTPAAKAPARQAAKRSYPGQEQAPRNAAESSANWHRRDPEMERMVAEYLASKALARKATGTPTRPPEPAPPAPCPSAPFDYEEARKAALAILGKAVPA